MNIARRGFRATQSQVASRFWSHGNHFRSYLTTGAIIIVALVLRLGYVVTLPDTLTFDEPIYNDIVTNMLTGRGYAFSGNAFYTALPYRPTSYQEPLYPFFLAGIYHVIGLGEFKMARAIQAVLNSMSIVLLMLIASKLWNRRIALIVGIIGTVYIPFIYLSGLLMTENLFVFWLLLFMYLWINAVQQGKFWLFFAAGVVFGAACLTRGMILFFLPILLLVTLVFTTKRIPKFLYGTGLILIGAVIAIAPWTIRNYVVQNAFVPITTKGGFALYLYTYPTENFDFNNRWDQIPIPDMNGLSETQRDSKFQKLAIENIKSYPLLQLKFAFFKLLDFWNPVAERGPWYARAVFVVMFVVVIIPAIVGAIQMLKNTSLRLAGMLIVSLVLFHMIAAAIFTGGGKARLPIEPLLILLGGGGISLLSSIQPRFHGNSGSGGLRFTRE